MILKLISGGQTGADLGALAAARDNGFTTGGWCPPDRANENGLIPSCYNLIPTPKERSPLAPDVPRSMRTEWNVRDSDATLLFHHDDESPGCRWTRVAATEIYKRPILTVHLKKDPEEHLNTATIWLKTNRPATLNVAGPPESVVPGTERHVYKIIADLLSI